MKQWPRRPNACWAILRLGLGQGEARDRAQVDAEARAALVHGAKSAVAEIGHIRVGVLSFVRALNGPKRDSLVPVLASLLHCSPEETRALWRSVGVEPGN